LAQRVGVISFGTTARVDLPLTEIAPDSFEELSALEARLHETIVADDLGNTQPLKAFELIPAMFRDSQITSGGPRKHVVIFLTDGLIDFGDNGNNAGLGFTGASYQLANYVNNNFPFDEDLLEREKCISFLVEAYGKMENIPYEKMNECMQENEVSDDAYEDSIYVYIVLMNYGQSWPPAVKDYYHDITDSHAGEVMDFYEQGGENRNEIPTYFQNVFALS
jgi:hypothetical protein